MRTPLRDWSGLERGLGMAVIVLALALIAGTIAAFIAKIPGRAQSLTNATVSTADAAEGRIASVYDGIGAIRAQSADPEPALVLVDIAFPYDANDTAFVEELDDKAPRLRVEASSFFSSKSRDELVPAFEGALKAELRLRLNALLSLGAIEDLWFAAFSVVD